MINGIKTVKSVLIFPIIKEILNSGSIVRITVTGMSMYPFLRENIDSVEFSSTDFNNIRRGDIVLILRDSGEYVMHRVIKKKNKYFYIAGDAHQWIEGPLKSKHLVAVIIAIWRRDMRIDCRNPVWRLLSIVWMVLLPFRYFILKTYSRASISLQNKEKSYEGKGRP